MAQMTDSELLNLIEHEEANCIGTTSGELSSQRQKAMEYYYSQPYGNEVEGRSQVVTSEVLDAIEGILPALMGIFTSSDEIVRFEPQGPEDEAASQQATDFINYIFSRLNNGFLVLYCFFKDALLQKNGFCKVYWEEYDSAKKDTYQGLDENTFTMMVMDAGVEVLAHTKNEDGTHDVVLRKTRKEGRVCIEPIPPEEVLISRDTPNEIKRARFVEHRRKMTVSQLREMGFEVSDDIGGPEASAEYNMERLARTDYDDSGSREEDSGALDKSMKEVWVSEAYVKADFDGDGIAESRKVTKVGRKILDNVEFDGVPIVTASPIIMPHKIMGLSLADLVMDIQLVKSTITRQLLDNAYHQNNRQYEVLDGMVNMDDMLTSRPGGIKRVKAIGSIKPIDVPLFGAPFVGLLNYFDQVKESRVGKRTFAPGPNADVLKGTATGAEVYKAWDEERTLLIARILAETGVKELFWKILELVSKHQTQPQIVKLRNKWVQVDPREWKDKFNMTVTVGLGTGSQQQTLQGAMGLIGVQFEMMKAGLADRVVTEMNMFNAAKEYAKAIFPKKADSFFTDPSQLPPKQQQPDPKIMLAAEKAKMSDAQKRDKMRQEAELHTMDTMKELDMQKRELMHDAQAIGSEQAHDSRMKGADMAHEAGMGAVQMHHDGNKMMGGSGNVGRSDKPPQSSSNASQAAPASLNIVVDQNEGLNTLVAAIGELAQAQSQSNEVQSQANQMIAEAVRIISTPKKVTRKTKAIRDTKDRLIGSESVEEQIVSDDQ